MSERHVLEKVERGGTSEREAGGPRAATERMEGTR